MNFKSNINTMSIDFECQISWSSIYKAKKAASRRLFRPVINREILLGAGGSSRTSEEELKKD